MYKDLPNAKKQYLFSCGHVSDSSNVKRKMIDKKRFLACHICKETIVVETFFQCVKCGKKISLDDKKAFGRVKYCETCKKEARRGATLRGVKKYAKKNREKIAAKQRYSMCNLTKKDNQAATAKRKFDCRFLWIKCFPECVANDRVLDCSDCPDYVPISNNVISEIEYEHFTAIADPSWSYKD